MKQLYIVRHCKADGQSPDALLTELGTQQAENLIGFFTDKKVDRIISSPYVRAIKTIEPLAKKLNKSIEIDDRLSERVLSSDNLVDWMECLQQSFNDLELSFVGGESSRVAMERGRAVVEDILHRRDENIVIVTHGNLMALLLKSYDERIGFNEWKELTNPDVYSVLIDHNGIKTLNRIWS